MRVMGAKGGGMETDRQLLNQYWTELCRTVRRRFGPGPPDPEEVAQAAFERLTIASKSSLISNPRAFLHRCARNFVLNEKRHNLVASRFALDSIAADIENRTDEFDAQRVLEARERLELVKKAVAGLDERRRQILLLRQIDELSFSEIAQQMNLSRTRVVQLFSEALLVCAQAAKAADEEIEVLREKKA